MQRPKCFKTNKPKNLGVTLVELLVYIALLSVLLVTSFSMAFILGKGQDELALSTERQIHSLAFIEAVRNRVETDIITKPLENQLTGDVIFSSGFFFRREGNKWQDALSHKYIFVPENISFNRTFLPYINLEGSFLLRGTTSQLFQIPILLRDET